MEDMKLILYEKMDKEKGKEYAYRVLKDNIMCLELKPGDSINENDLVEKLNISRTPIREVLIKLKGEHLVEVKPKAGTYVSKIDWDVIEQALFVRYTLENEVLKEACTIDFPEHILKQMEELISEQRAVCNDKTKALEFHNLDKEFHRLLFYGVRKSSVWDCITTISTHYNRMRILADMREDKSPIVDQHEGYINIIRNKRVDVVTAMMDSHIKAPVNSWKKYFDDEIVSGYIQH